MRVRGLVTSLALVLVLGAMAWLGDVSERPAAEGEDRLGLAASATGVATDRRRRFDCRGLSHRQVRGPRPSYTRKKLAEFRNHRRMCRALWMPRPRKTFVPQGISVWRSTAWVSGYLWRPGYGQRQCRLVKVDLRTGKRLDYRAVVGRVGQRPMTYCRHGGGLLHRGRQLWIVEGGRLWLVEPGRTTSSTIRARRVWRLRDPVRGSSIVARGDRIGLVPFRVDGRPAIRWFPLKALMRRGVHDLAARSRGRNQLGAVAATPIATRVQGAAYDASGRLVLTRSRLSCGELVTGGARIGFVPGAEGVAFGPRGDRLWVVSESGARPFARSRKPLTPAISSFEWPGVVQGRRSDCEF